MWSYLWPILLVVGANTLYNITAKSTPTEVNAFASLSITYLVAAAFSIVLFFVTSQSKDLLFEMKKANWTAFAFGFAIIALEFGYINLYRAGWRISVGSLVANLSLACVLLVVSVLLYKEVVTVRQLLGMAVCAVGLILINK